jgi:hypothetical protein
VRLGPAAPAALLVGGTAYALVAASTTPFTQPANVLTGLAIVVMAVLVVVRWPRRTASIRPAGHPYRLWWWLVVVFAVWELFNYVAPGSRGDHPTFSSITDAIDRFYLLKALLFLGWLAGFWVILRRGAPEP